MDEPQVERQSDDIQAERRAFLQTLRHRRWRCLARAVWAYAFVNLDPRHNWLDRRYIHFVIGVMEGLIRLVQSPVALAAAFRHDANDLVRILRQRTVRAFAPQASRTRTCSFRFAVLAVTLVLIGFEPLRRRYARITAVLRRLIQSSLKFSNAPLLFFDPLFLLFNLLHQCAYQGFQIPARASVKVFFHSRP